ncbi:MAG TPA: membrane dipeptidase [Anaerolineales bacterium]|nr:membrane dipeptidase [Anaerolineales bacterium]
MPTLDWKRIHMEATIIDLHVHPSMQQQLFNRNLGLRYVINRTFHANPMSVRASFPRLHDGGYDAILSVLYVPEHGILRDFPIVRLFRFLRPDIWGKLMRAQPYAATRRLMADMERAVADPNPLAPVKMAASVSDLDSILSQPKGQRPIAVIHAIEGAHSLGGPGAGDDEVMYHLEELHDCGVGCITLAHFYPNRVVHPCYPFPEDIARLSVHPTLWRDLTLGLTDLGRHVVERMIEMGMLIDLSHCTPTARQEIYDIADASGRHVPLLATHVGAYELDPSPYNLTDREIQRIARDGGVIGVIFMPYWLMPKESGQGINFISRHIQYLIDMGGEDVVGLGTDFDGFTTPPDDLDNASQMPRLTQRLVVDGHSEARIKKILGGNALRAIHAGWRQ